MSASNPNNRIVGNMSAPQLVALHAETDRHPNALNTELVRAPMAALVALAYGEHGELGYDVPYELAEAAYNEIERRQNALSALLADNPTIAAALALPRS